MTLIYYVKESISSAYFCMYAEYDLKKTHKAQILKHKCDLLLNKIAVKIEVITVY